jgi:methionyl-tRNA formyltransferase
MTAPPDLATVFMGTPDIAVGALRLLHARTRLVHVVTQPDRPAGRGHQPQPPPVKTAALALGVPVWQPESLKGSAGDPRLACDLIVVMAYGALLRQDLLDRPRFGCVNLHASLLPRWRGASPLQAALRAGDADTGVTVMRMVRALDAGPMFNRVSIPIAPGMTLPALHDRLAEAAAQALAAFLDAWPPPEPTAQDDAAATHCRKLVPDDGRLDFRRPAADLERWVRAYTPAPGCWAALPGAPAGLDRLRIIQVAPRPAAPPLAPGAVAAQGSELLIGTGDHPLAVLRLQSPGSRAQDARDWLNGHRPPETFG